MTEWINEITLFLAIWGFTLSTILGVIKINDIIRKIHVKIKLFCVLNEQLELSDPRYFEYRLQLQSMNNGKRPIEFIGCGVQIDEIQKILYNIPAGETVEFPKTINDGQSIIITFDIEKILSFLVKNGTVNTKKIRGFFVDGNDKEYYSKNINFNAVSILDFYPKVKEEHNQKIHNSSNKIDKP